ncbi:AGE family epimerase/isomerase [Terrimonas pollutisoli]|uniref:AGE family epimerase/isomerase n=1 Tax=Terrimonas pollutisoli TaxID=3034147 RepID=UPI0023EC8EE6|nr:AGE family epimerase/isomerase [Terrimonas sp. H1YJ31]
MKAFICVIKNLLFALLFMSDVQAQNLPAKKEFRQERLRLADEMEKAMRNELLNKWYPQSVDSVYGGFLTTFTYDFQPTGPQDKMIVTQARHVWSNALASRLYPQTDHYKKCAAQGFVFLKNKMWDKNHGGFYTLVDRKGNLKDSSAKTAYGNAFGIYASAAWYKASGDKAALQLAKDCFQWLEKAHDPVYKGYYQDLLPDGTPIKRTAVVPSTSSLGYKDQNSSIHLLEAFTELYSVWPNELLQQRLKEMLYLVRDVITTPRGGLTLFLRPDWTPVTFADSSELVVLKHRNLDHISFGHDVETAYLMLEALHVLGLKNDTATMKVAKRMVDHALQNGWDKKNGGFYDEGYYFKNKSTITIIKNSKNWWSQAECLNTLLLMADHFPNDSMRYFEKFKKQWQYIKIYIIDHQYGDWYEEGLDTRPEKKKALKGHIWKATYHQLRSLSNCVQHLRKQ